MKRLVPIIAVLAVAVALALPRGNTAPKAATTISAVDPAPATADMGACPMMGKGAATEAKAKVKDECCADEQKPGAANTKADAHAAGACPMDKQECAKQGMDPATCPMGKAKEAKAGSKPAAKGVCPMASQASASASH